MPTLTEKVQIVVNSGVSSQEYARRADMRHRSAHVTMYKYLTGEALGTPMPFSDAWRRAEISSEDQATKHLNHMVRVLSSQSTPAVVRAPEVIETANKIVPYSMPTTIDMKKYGHNIMVGFEFEMRAPRGNSDEIITTICNKYGIKSGKTVAKVVEQEVTLSDSQGNSTRVKMPTLSDPYKHHDIVTACYNDGSIGPEVVTRPVRFDQLDNEIKPIFDYLKTMGNFNHSSAGLHMTFVLDNHKEKSFFERKVVKNMMQLVRTYYPMLIMKYKNPATNRELRYRSWYSKSAVDNITTEKYNACNLRKLNSGNVWAIEMRIPDGTDNWETIKEQVLLYMCMIRHAAKVAEKGMITIPVKYFKKIESFVSVHQRYQSTAPTVYSEIKTQLEEQADKVFKPERDFFSYTEQEQINYETTNVEVY